jgi:hypothetical protein
MVRRHALLALLAAVAASGCRAGSNSALVRPNPVAVRPAENKVVAQDVADYINRNSQSVHSLVSKATVSATGRRRFGGGADGKLALERPHKFRLTLSAPGRPELADLGSNPEHFWFATSEEKTIYVGDYDEAGQIPPNVPLPMQPDWLVEALGLREITPEEVAAMTVKETRPGVLVLSYPRTNGRGETFKKVMIVDKRTMEVHEHQLYTNDDKIIAKAEIAVYQPASGPDPENPAQTVTASLPQTIKVTWVPDGMELIARLNDPRINVLTEDATAELFEEPQKEGYARMTFNTPSSDYAAGPTTIRETRPSPAASDNGVGFGEPIPLGDDGATRAGGPAAFAPDLPTSRDRTPEPEAVIGARIARAPASRVPEPATFGGRSGRGFGWER